LHSGYQATEAGGELAGVQVPPAPLDSKIERRGRSAERTPEDSPRRFPNPDVHRVHGLAQLHPLDHPRGTEPEDGLIQLPVFHASPPGARSARETTYPLNCLKSPIFSSQLNMIRRASACF